MTRGSRSRARERGLGGGPLRPSRTAWLSDAPGTIRTCGLCLRPRAPSTRGGWRLPASVPTWSSRRRLVRPDRTGRRAITRHEVGGEGCEGDPPPIVRKRRIGARPLRGCVVGAHAGEHERVGPAVVDEHVTRLIRVARDQVRCRRADHHSRTVGRDPRQAGRAGAVRRVTCRSVAHECRRPRRHVAQEDVPEAFLVPGTRFEAADWNTTRFPSFETEAASELPFSHPPPWGSPAAPRRSGDRQRTPRA